MEIKPYFDDIESAILAINFLILVTIIPIAFSKITIDLRIIGVCLAIVFFLTVGIWVHKTERRIQSECKNKTPSCPEPRG